MGSASGSRWLARSPPTQPCSSCTTTAVDTATEARIAGRLRGARAGRTTVLVTTSPALLAAADRVVMLLHGTVAAQGSHTGLVRSSPAYREAVLA